MDNQKDKKKTKLIRVDSVWHRIIKVKASKKGISMTKLIKKMCESYFNENTYKKFKDKIDKNVNNNYD